MAFWRDRMHYACVAWEGLTKPWRRALAWLALFDLALALASAHPSFSPSGHVAVLEIDRRAQIKNSLLPFRKSSTVHRPRCRAVCSLQFWRGWHWADFKFLTAWGLHYLRWDVIRIFFIFWTFLSRLCIRTALPRFRKRCPTLREGRMLGCECASALPQIISVFITNDDDVKQGDTYSGAVVSTVNSHQREFSMFSRCAWVLSWVLRLPPEVQKHAGEANWEL